MIVRKLFLLALASVVAAEQDVDDAYNDDAAQQYYYANLNQNDTYFSAGDAYIKYWTDYAIIPKRCIV